MILDSCTYDPASAVSKSTASRIAMTALDTTNLRCTFTVPASGNVLVRLKCITHGAVTVPSILLGVLEGSTVKGRVAPHSSAHGTVLATDMVSHEVVFMVTGLTPEDELNWDAAYGVETEIASSAIKYGGPDDTTANNAFGAFVFEVWRA